MNTLSEKKFKGIFHPKMKIHPYVILNRHEFLSSVEDILINDDAVDGTPSIVEKT